MDEVGRLLAYEEIRQLAARYAFAVDTRDLDTLVGLFIPSVQVGRDLTGRDALRASCDTQLRGIGQSILNVGTHVIDLLDADHATGWVYTKAEIEATAGGSTKRSCTRTPTSGSSPMVGSSFAASTSSGTAPYPA